MAPCGRTHSGNVDGRLGQCLTRSKILETLVEQTGYFGAIHIAAYEHKFLHAVAIHRIPVTKLPGLALHKLFEFLLGRFGKPKATFGEFLLHTGLLEKIGHGGILLKITYAFGADDALGPMARHEIVELIQR